MFTELTGTTGAMLRLALDAASLRHLAIAHNIANANTPDFAPLRVSFEDQLAAASRALNGNATADRARLAAIRPAVSAESSAGVDPKVMIDQELVQLNQNTIHYQALLKGLQTRMEIMQAAINDGRR